MNQVELIGRITRDLGSKIKSIGNNGSLVNFTLAVPRNYKSKDGKDADFIRCSAFDKTAQVLAKYTAKGSLISVVGSINTQLGKNGSYYETVDIRSFEFLESRLTTEKRKNSAN